MTELETKPAHDPAGADQTEYAAEDDSIIGSAFKWSLLVIAFIIAAVIATILLRSGGEESDPIIITKDPGAITAIEIETERLPDVVFTDVTTDAGIDFTHANGGIGERMLPETMGSGVAFLDLALIHI